MKGHKIEVEVKCVDCFNDDIFSNEICNTYVIKDFFEKIAFPLLNKANSNIDYYVIKEQKGERVLKKYRTFHQEKIQSGTTLLLMEKKFDRNFMKQIQVNIKDRLEPLLMAYNPMMTFNDLKNQIMKKLSLKMNKNQPPYFSHNQGRDLLDLDERITSYSFDNDKEITFHFQVNKDIDKTYKFIIIFDTEPKFDLNPLQIMKIGQLKNIISRNFKIEKEDFALLMDDRFINESEDNNILKDYNLEENETYELMIFQTKFKKNFLYEVLKFMQDLKEVETRDENGEHLLQLIEKFFTFSHDKRPRVESFLKEMKEDFTTIFNKYIQPAYGMAIKLYTSELLHKSLNTILQAEDYNSCLDYLSYFYKGFIQLPLYNGKEKVFKGVSFKPNHTIGECLIWFHVNSLTTDFNVAMEFCTKKNTIPPQTIYELDVVSARSLEILSLKPSEKEVTLFPYTYMKVTGKKDDSKTGLVTYSMEEIPSPRGHKVLLWIDDNPGNNVKFVEFLESIGVSCVCIKSTELVKDFFDHHLWLLTRKNSLNKRDASNFKIITDMTRIENNELNPIAGVQAINYIIKMNFNKKILIFTSDKQKAHSLCLENGLDESKFICEDKNTGIINYLQEDSFVTASLQDYENFIASRRKWDEVKEKNYIVNFSNNRNSESKRFDGKKGNSCVIF